MEIRVRGYSEDFEGLRQCTYGVEVDLGNDVFTVILIREKPDPETLRKLFLEIRLQYQTENIREMSIEEIQEFLDSVEDSEVDLEDIEDEDEKWNIEMWNPEKWDKE